VLYRLQDEVVIKRIFCPFHKALKALMNCKYSCIPHCLCETCNTVCAGKYLPLSFPFRITSKGQRLSHLLLTFFWDMPLTQHTRKTIVWDMPLTLHTRKAIVWGMPLTQHTGKTIVWDMPLTQHTRKAIVWDMPLTQHTRKAIVWDMPLTAYS
jgi:hypothetical protein